jgi:hypothetical protein
MRRKLKSINSYKNKGVISMRAIIILLAAIIPVNSYGAGYNICRINETGTIIDGPVYYESADPGRVFGILCKVSDLGYIYTYDDSYVRCFNQSLQEVGVAYGTGSYGWFALDNARDEVLTDYTIRRYNATLDEYESIPVPYVTYAFTVDEYDGAIWWYPYTSDDEAKGLYKFARDGTLIYFFPEYEGYIGYTRVSSNGRFWTKTLTGSALINRDGSLQITGPSVGYWKVMYLGDESCWSYPWYYESGSGSFIAKLNSSGVLVYYNPTDFNRPHSLDVNQDDGSVWIADTYNYDIVHLDQNGGEILRTDWDWVARAIAVDPADGTVIVVSSLGDVSIEPTSIGRIKAEFK